jgi:hypothetical protein
LSRQCGNFDVSRTYRPPQPVTRIGLPLVRATAAVFLFRINRIRISANFEADVCLLMTGYALKLFVTAFITGRDRASKRKQKKQKKTRKLEKEEKKLRRMKRLRKNAEYKIKGERLENKLNNKKAVAPKHCNTLPHTQLTGNICGTLNTKSNVTW